MTFTEEQVEAGARALWDARRSPSNHTWDAIAEGGLNRPYPTYPHIVDDIRREARAVLSAALRITPAERPRADAESDKAIRAQEASGGLSGGRGGYVEPPEPPGRRAQEATRKLEPEWAEMRDLAVGRLERLEAVEDFITAHYLDTSVGERVLAIINGLPVEKTGGETDE